MYHVFSMQHHVLGVWDVPNNVSPYAGDEFGVVSFVVWRSSCQISSPVSLPVLSLKLSLSSLDPSKDKHVQMIHVYTAGRQLKSRLLLYIAFLLLSLSHTYFSPFLTNTQSHSLSSKPSTPTPPFPREQKRGKSTTEVNFIPWIV